MNSKPIQAGGMNHVWASPSRSFKHPFLRLENGCEVDNYPGVVILADEGLNHSIAVAVENLRKELPALLDKREGETVIYWWLEEDTVKRGKLYKLITENPVYIG